MRPPIPSSTPSPISTRRYFAVTYLEINSDPRIVTRNCCCLILNWFWQLFFQKEIEFLSLRVIYLKKLLFECFDIVCILYRESLTLQSFQKYDEGKKWSKMRRSSHDYVLICSVTGDDFNYESMQLLILIFDHIQGHKIRSNVVWICLRFV